MAYEFIKGLFGTNEDGTPRALTADQLEAAIAENKDISIVNLKEGGYISADKYSRIEAERNSLQEQLKKAGTGSGTADQDLQAAKQQIEELQKQLQLQGRRSAISEYLSGYQFTSSFAKKGILAEMEKLDSVTVVDGELIGAEAALADLKARYAEAFKEEEPVQAGPDPGAAPPNMPRFTSTSSLSGTGSNPKKSGPMTLSEAMRYKNEHPNADVSGLFNR